METERIDKYLWATRVFKTRGKVADACKKGKVIVEGQQAKPSKLIKPGDIIEVKKLPALFTYRVKKLLETRQSAKISAEHIENMTPEEEMIKLKANNLPIFEKRERGMGRPTKKERRIINKLKNNDLP